MAHEGRLKRNETALKLIGFKEGEGEINTKYLSRYCIFCVLLIQPDGFQFLTDRG